MIGPSANIFETMRLGWAMAQLGAEVQSVMTLRLMGLAGCWALPPGEAGRMVSEKSPAWNDAWMKAAQATANGATSVAVVDAALKPLHRKAKANRKRLSKQRG